MTITEFLLARIAEDEDEAARMGCAEYYDGGWSLEHEVHIRKECAAKRAIIAFDQDHQVWCPRGISDDTDAEAFVQGGPKDPQARHVTRMLATVYSDHPDYQQEWAV